MVPIRFSDFRDSIEEVHSRHEMFDRPVFTNPLTAVGQIPTFDLGQLCGRFIQR